MKKETYKYIQHGFEAILYDAENGDDRLLIVIQGLKGLDLPEKYAQLFSEKGYHNLGYFPVNNNMLPREKKYPNECQRAREETLDLIIRALDAWCV